MSANLPETKISRAFVSELLPAEILRELDNLGVTPLFLKKSERIPNQTAYHPDILINNYKTGKWISDRSDITEAVTLDISEKKLGSIYPSDCLFNCFSVKNRLYYGRGTAGEIITQAEREGMTRVFVKQGYVKCSVFIISENAFITADVGIYNRLKTDGFDALLISSDGISLSGYGCGFIGGCGGLISPDSAVFFGDVGKHANGNDIKAFSRNHGVDIISLSTTPLYDYGGLLGID